MFYPFKWIFPPKPKYYDYEITLDDRVVGAFSIPANDIDNLDRHICEIMYEIIGHKVEIEHCIDGWGQDIIKVRQSIKDNNWWLVRCIGVYNER